MKCIYTENAKTIKKNPAPDRRVRKTKTSIRDAFILLMMRKDFAQITVKEITETADISRRTFYTHYNSIDDILTEMNIELSDNVLSLFSGRDFTHATTEDIKEMFARLNDILNRNYAFYKRLASINSYSFFINMLSDVIRQIIRTTLKQDFDADEKVIFAYSEYMSAGIIALYIGWLREESDYPLDQLVDIAADITYGGIRSLIEQEH